MMSDSVGFRFRGFQLPDYVSAVLLALNAAWWGSSIAAGSLWLDEVLYARAGYSLVSGNPFVNPTHMFAPFAKYVIGAGQLVFGPSEFGSRVGIVLFAILSLGAVYSAPRLLGRPWAGVLSVAGLSVIPLFSTHATSAMLDIPLVFAVTLLGATVLLESEHPGSERRDVLVGFATLLACSTKSYGFIYALGPSVAYFLLRRRHVPIVQPLRRAVGAAIGSFVLVYLPIALGTPPDYYSGATLPPIVKRVFDIPLLGGVAYAFGASFYHNLTGHAATSPSLLTFVSWMVKGGPLVIFGVLSAVGAYFLPDGVRVGPHWLPATLLLIPLVVFVLVLPKGFARYALPIFPVAIVYGVLVCSNALDELDVAPSIRTLGMFALILAVISPSSAFLFGGTQLSADSKYQEASRVLSDATEQDVTVVAEQPVVLRWYLGEKKVEKYYFDPTEAVKLVANGGPSVTVIGVSPIDPESYRDAAEQISTSDVDYVVLNGRVSPSRRETPLKCGSRLRSWEAYWTGDVDSHTVSVWNTEGC